jgi:hypothetical protein
MGRESQFRHPNALSKSDILGPKRRPSPTNMGSEYTVRKGHTLTRAKSKTARSHRAFANPQIVVMSEGISVATNPVSKVRAKPSRSSVNIVAHYG